MPRTPRKAKTDSKPDKNDEQPKSKPRKARVLRPYPRKSLESSLKVGEELKSKNGGNSWPTEEVANAIGLSKSGNDFFYLTALSRDFGLTSGTREAKEIALTDFGKTLFYAPNADVEQQKKKEAFFSIDLFNRVYEHYHGFELPEAQYLSNTLETTFDLDPTIHDEFIELFKANCIYLGLPKSLSDGGSNDATNSTTHASPTRVVGGPKQKKGQNLTMFVVMPFSEKTPDRATGFFGEVLNSLIVPAGSSAGFQVETANRDGSDIIQSTIIIKLLSADLVLADLTDHNPNVLFELGLRIAMNKPVVIIKATGTKSIFDVDSMMRYYQYNGNLWKSTIDLDVDKLGKHIQSAWDERDSDLSYMNILTRSKT